MDLLNYVVNIRDMVSVFKAKTTAHIKANRLTLITTINLYEHTKI